MNEVLEKALNTQKEADQDHAVRNKAWDSRVGYTRKVLVPLMHAVLNEERLKRDLQGATFFDVSESDYLATQTSWPERRDRYELSASVRTVHLSDLRPCVVVSVACPKERVLEEHHTLDLRVMGDTSGSIYTNHLHDNPPLRLRLPTPDEAVMSKWVTDVVESVYQYWLDTMYDERTYFYPEGKCCPKGKVLPLDEWVEQSGFSKYVYKGAPDE